MLSIEELKALNLRLQKGKEKIEAESGDWSGGTRVPFDAKSRKNKALWDDHKNICKQVKPIKCTCGLTKLQKYLCQWWELDELFWNSYTQQQALIPGSAHEKKHSTAWHKMKQEEALYKWKHQLKAKRGPDPRLQPVETFV
jgi:hypothetical protein